MSLLIYFIFFFFGGTADPACPPSIYITREEMLSGTIGEHPCLVTITKSKKIIKNFNLLNLSQLLVLLVIIKTLLT